MKNSEMEQIVGAYLAAYNAFDVDGMVALLAPDVIFRNVSEGKVTHETIGVPAFRTLAEQGAEMFSERHQELIGLAFENGADAAVVAATIRFRGVLAADNPATGCERSPIELVGRSEFGFRDGKIAAITDVS
jgi:ketosteroid isomerase-like protein